MMDFIGFQQLAQVILDASQKPARFAYLAIHHVSHVMGQTQLIVLFVLADIITEIITLVKLVNLTKFLVN